MQWCEVFQDLFCKRMFAEQILCGCLIELQNLREWVFLLLKLNLPHHKDMMNQLVLWLADIDWKHVIACSLLFHLLWESATPKCTLIQTGDRGECWWVAYHFLKESGKRSKTGFRIARKQSWTLCQGQHQAESQINCMFPQLSSLGTTALILPAYRRPTVDWPQIYV